MATKPELEAMYRINPHFTFRERCAFLCGWRERGKLDQPVYGRGGREAQPLRQNEDDATPARQGGAWSLNRNR